MTITSARGETKESRRTYAARKERSPIAVVPGGRPARNIPKSRPPKLPDPIRDRGFHLALPSDRSGGFCANHDRIRAAKLCIESKSLKFYLASYRNERAFNEAVTNRILDDFVRACSPREAVVTAEFSARGGIALTVRAEFPDANSTVGRDSVEPTKSDGSAERRPTKGK